MGSRRAERGLPRLVVIVTSIIVFAAPSAAAPAPGDCVVTPADQLVDSVEMELATLINDHRVQNGRPRLVIHPDLTRSAAWFSRSMASGNNFQPDHVDANARTIPQRFAWCGARYNASRENIAASTSGRAIDNFNIWVGSPTDNNNMLATDVRSMGVARAFDASSDYDYYFTLTLSDSVPIPPADFDDSGTTDIGVFRPGNPAGWYVQGQAGALWGQNGDIPVPGDYDGDGKTDIAVFRPSNGGWYILG